MVQGPETGDRQHRVSASLTPCMLVCLPATKTCEKKEKELGVLKKTRENEKKQKPKQKETKNKESGLGGKDRGKGMTNERTKDERHTEQ